MDQSLLGSSQQEWHSQKSGPVFSGLSFAMWFRAFAGNDLSRRVRASGRRKVYPAGARAKALSRIWKYDLLIRKRAI